MRILVVGGGWYGCHLALTLAHAGMTVTLAECEDRLFARASGNNQNRLHLGLHYPRSHRTRVQALHGFNHFLATYPGLCAEVACNFYGVASEGSIVDFGTFLQVCAASGIDARPIDPQEAGLSNVEGAVACQERLVLTDLARTFFQRTLHGHVQTSRRIRHVRDQGSGVIVDGEMYDWCVNTTWFSFDPPAHIPHWFEPTVLFIYRTREPGVGRTIMDGDFCSMYPYQNDTVSLSSVPLSPQGHFPAFAAARHCLDRLTSSNLADLRRRMEEQARQFCPIFDDLYTPVDVQLSVKTKMPDAAAARVCMVIPQGRVIHVFAGKIDAIFTAEDAVFAILEACSGVASHRQSAFADDTVLDVDHRSADTLESAHRAVLDRRSRLRTWRN